jgi:hypothetical protein
MAPGAIRGTRSRANLRAASFAIAETWRRSRGARWANLYPRAGPRARGPARAWRSHRLPARTVSIVDAIRHARPLLGLGEVGVEQLPL